MQTIKNILDIKRFQKKPKGGIVTEWQALAMKVAQGLGCNQQELNDLMTHFKRNHKVHLRFLETAYNFTIDYEGRVPKIKLFYWKFFDLIKNKYAKGKYGKKENRANQKT